MKQPIAVTTDNFEESVLRAEGPVLVDFWAEWCAPCRRLSPIVDEIAAETDAVRVCKVNVDESPQLAGRYHVSSIPTLMLFRDGKLSATSTGVRSKEAILQMIGLHS